MYIHVYVRIYHQYIHVYSARFIECLVGPSINKGCAVYYYSVVMHGLRISRYLANEVSCKIRGEFNNASARRALVDWYLSLFIMCKA